MGAHHADAPISGGRSRCSSRLLWAVACRWCALADSSICQFHASCLLGVAMIAGVPIAGAEDAGDPSAYGAERDRGEVELLEEAKASSQPWRRAMPGVIEPAAEPEPPLGEWGIVPAGQIRLRGDFTRNQNLSDFGFTPHEKEAQFLERSRLAVSADNPGLGVKLFVQGQSYGRWGGDEQRSDFELYQGYVEWNQVLGFPLDLKLGRQDLEYGSTFFLGTNDFYDGLSWDAVKASLRPVDDLVVDVLAGRMAKLNPGDPDVYLGGLHAAYATSERGSMALYLFVNKGGFPFFHREFELHDSDQRWFTVGTRLAGARGGFDYELEPQFQWGRVRTVAGDASDDVRAYGGHLDVGYKLDASWQPRVFTAYAFGSGHTEISDGRYGEFHGTLFNDNYLVGDMGVFADLSGVMVGDVHASGMHVGVAGFSIDPGDGLHVGFDVHRFFADKVPSGFSSDLGVELDLTIAYELTSSITILVGLNRFFTGSFFEQASGSNANIDYAYLQTELEF